MIVLADAEPGDLMGIVALEAAFPVGQRWSAELWAQELVPGHTTIVAKRDNEVLGVVTLMPAGDVTDLTRVVVASATQRQGIADQLLNAGLARTTGRVLLEVRDDNTPALALYAKHGFARIARRKDYYGLGADALVLERAAKEESHV